MSRTLKFELSKCDKPTSSVEINRAGVQAIVDEIAGLERERDQYREQLIREQQKPSAAYENAVTALKTADQRDDAIRDNVRLMEYAEELTAPARELLFLYDWRFELAEQESRAKQEPEKWSPQAAAELKRKLREYGERKKAGWIALRAALAKAAQPTAQVCPKCGAVHGLCACRVDTVPVELNGVGNAEAMQQLRWVRDNFADELGEQGHSALVNAIDLLTPAVHSQGSHCKHGHGNLMSRCPECEREAG